MPDGFPYVWMGDVGLSYDCVGLLVAHELEPAIHELEHVGGHRRRWYFLPGLPHAHSGGPIIICGMYPAPVGDVST